MILSQKLVLITFKRMLLKKCQYKSYGSCILHSACRGMLVNICTKFHEDILNGFKVIERT